MKYYSAIKEGTTDASSNTDENKKYYVVPKRSDLKKYM